MGGKCHLIVFNFLKPPSIKFRTLYFDGALYGSWLAHKPLTRLCNSSKMDILIVCVWHGPPAHRSLINRSYIAHMYFNISVRAVCVHFSFPLSYLSCPSLSFSSSFICPSLFDASRPFLLFGFAFLFSNPFFSRLLS